MKKILLALVILLIAGSAFASNIDGKWQGEIVGQNMKIAFNFKAEGEKLTGTHIVNDQETAIENGKIEGNKISFTVTLNMGQEMKIPHKGTISGDEIKMTYDMMGQPGEILVKKAKKTESESQIALNDNRKKQLENFFSTMPDVVKQIGAQMETAYKDGAIDSKTKRLMALAIALGAGCRNCVLAHTEAALELGATKEEFFETISVVVSMRGTTGVAESIRVIQFLDELGKI